MRSEKVGIILSLNSVSPEQLVYQVLPEGNYEMAFRHLGHPHASLFIQTLALKSSSLPKERTISRLNDYQVDRILNQLDRTFDLKEQKQTLSSIEYHIGRTNACGAFVLQYQDSNQQTLYPQLPSQPICWAIHGTAMSGGVNERAPQWKGTRKNHSGRTD